MNSLWTVSRLRARDPLSHALRSLSLVPALTALACAGHSAKTLDARNALDQGDAKTALALMNEQLEVKSGAELPKDPSGDNALLILDRSLIQQQLADYKHSSRDMEVADKQIELLDFSKSALEDIGKYLFSDDTGGYRAPPYEKLLINTMNMVNYLSAHNLDGARVEARRLAIMQKYYKDQKIPEAAMTAPGSYFAGFVFEKSGRSDIAIRYYDEALEHKQLLSLVEPVHRLVGETGYRGEFTSAFLEKYPAPAPSNAAPPTAAPSAAAAPDAPPEAATAPEGEATAAAEDTSGELLVMVNYGRVPAKVAKRIPIGLALTFGALYLSPAQTSQANELAAKGLVMWVNYPELEETKRVIGKPTVMIDGQAYEVEEALRVDDETRLAHERDKGRIIASAITRLITRAIAGELTQKAAGDGVGGLIANLATQATLTAMDTPDTRSWSTLPARIGIVRARLPAGKHKVDIAAQGLKKSTEIELRPGRWEAVGLTALR